MKPSNPFAREANPFAPMNNSFSTRGLLGANVEDVKLKAALAEQERVKNLGELAMKNTNTPFYDKMLVETADRLGRGLFGTKSPEEAYLESFNKRAQEAAGAFSGQDLTTPQGMLQAASKLHNLGYTKEAIDLMKQAEDFSNASDNSASYSETPHRYVDSEGNYYAVQGSDKGGVKTTPLAGSPKEPVGKLTPVGTSGDTGAVDQMQSILLAQIKNNLDKNKAGYNLTSKRFIETEFPDAVQTKSDLGIIEEQISRLESGGVATGTFAEFENIFDGVLAEVGLSRGDIASNTGAYKARSGQLVGQIIKLFGAGTGLSDADRKYAAQMAAGDITIHKNGLLTILNALKAASERSLARHNQKVKRRSDGFYDNLSDGSIREDYYVGEYGLPKPEGDDEFDKLFYGKP